MSSASWLALDNRVSYGPIREGIRDKQWRTVKHLALGAQAVTLGHQIVDLLSTL